MTPVEVARKYERDIIDGKIPACDELIGQCNRNQRDLASSLDDEDSSFGYYFCERTANAVCNFMPAALCHSIGAYQGQPFELTPWQVWLTCQLFGWKKKSNDARRFNKCYLTIARKNGKSTFASALALFMAGFDINPETNSPESISQVILAAVKMDQAKKVIYAEACRMQRSSPAIKKMSEIKNNQLTFSHNSGAIFCVASDKPMDGLNPSAIFLDEIHAFSNTQNQTEFVDTMKTGSGSRVQPLLMFTTTAGSDKSHLWLQEHGYASDVANGIIEDDSYLPIIYQIDCEKHDPLDESKWVMANPNLDITFSAEKLREQALPASRDSVALRRFQRYHANYLVSSTNSAFDMDAWDECAGELSDWSKADVICMGADMGGRDDLSAYAAVARFPHGSEQDEEGNQIWRYEARTFQCISDNTERDLDEQPFRQFIESGSLTVVRHPVAWVENGIEQFGYDNGAAEVAIDPFNASRSIEHLEGQGMTVVTFTQGYSHFCEPILDLMEAIRDRRFKHDGNPLLRWCAGNAMTVVDRHDRVMFDKGSSSDKIDPIVALTQAFARCSKAQSYQGGWDVL